MNSTIEIINKRMSIRAYEEKPIPKDIKASIINAALRSPTAGNGMLYSILDITDQEKKEKLAILCDNQPFIAKASLVLIFLADYQKIYDYLLHCGVRELCGSEGRELRTPQEGDLMLACSDAVIAAQTTVLAAESLGIGSCYIGDILERCEAIKELLNLPDYVFPITMLCYGYPTEQQLALPLTKRFDERFVVFENEYKSLSGVEYDEMYKERHERVFKGKEDINGLTNIGQLFNKNKYSSDFALEMNRSVREYVKNWKG